MKNLTLFLDLLHDLPQLDDAEYAFFSSRAPKTAEFVGPDEKVFIVKDGSLHVASLADGSTRSYSMGLAPDRSPLVKMLYNELNDAFYSFHRSGEVGEFRLVEGELVFRELDPIEGGIAAVAFSPDEEVGALVTTNNELLILKSMCEVFNFWDLEELADGEQAPVNVGWGRKETQFHGSAGKAAALPEVADLGAEGEGSTDIGDSVTIAWRADSSLFATSYPSRSTGRRQIKIFNRDGVFQSSGEEIPGLEVPLSWRSQSLLTMVQRLPNKYVVAFMEKNGLKHYDFTLPKHLRVVDLSVNEDSQILCVNCYDSVVQRNILLFWTSSNYHWYLKQSIECSARSLTVSWDKRRENRLKLFLSNGSVHIVEFAWKVDHSGYSQSDDSSYVAVIDDDKLLVTQFSAGVVPPPMAKWTLKCPSRLKQVCYPQTKSGYSLAAICQSEILLIAKDSNQNLAIIKSLKFSESETMPETFHSWVWLEENKFSCLDSQPGHISVLVVSINGLKLTGGKSVECFPVKSISTLSTGLLDLSGGQFSVPTGYPELILNQVQVKGLRIGLSESGRLYVDNQHVASNVSSFFFINRFLLVTTSLHTLLIFKQTSNGAEEISCRKLENGARIVTATGTSVVLQLPRGNLETIQPRALALVHIGSLLTERRYREAVYFIRKNRILLDVCVDHNPEIFLSDVNEFVAQVDTHSLNILISELTESDVTGTTYSAFYSKNRTSLNNKVNRVCSALLAELRHPELEKSSSLTILSCLVKMKRMSEAIEAANTEQTLQHLLFLVPVDKLYTAALEAHNLKAALNVAAKSQMDPKEYIPFLNQLRDMETNFMKFTIDNSAQKYSSALVHLANCGESRVNECFAFISQHSLYQQGLGVFQKNSDRYKRCAELYGEFLLKKRWYEEAGNMFSRAGLTRKALEAFILSHNWSRCIALAKLMKLGEQEMIELCDNLHVRLVEARLYEGAAQLCELHSSNKKFALSAYVMAKCWDQALRVAHSYDLLDLIDTDIKPQILEHAACLLDDIRDKSDALSKYVKRLKVVRTEKANKPAFQCADDMSETSSVTTRSGTSHTSRSSKMTRKANRKLWSLKEGNPREEEALLSALQGLAKSSETMLAEVRNICEILVYLDIDDRAKELQNRTKGWLLQLHQSMPMIWPKDHNCEPTAAIDAAIRCAPDLHTPSNWELDILSVNTRVNKIDA